jgi:hypothetical protein
MRRFHPMRQRWLSDAEGFADCAELHVTPVKHSHPPRKLISCDFFLFNGTRFNGMIQGIL